MFTRIRHLLPLRRLTIAVGLIVVFLALGASFVMAEGLDPTSPTLTSAPSCRYGAAALSSTQMTWLEPLNLGWHLNFGPQNYPGPEASEFVPVISLLQQRDGCTRQPGYSFQPPLTDAGLGAAVRRRPGSLWIIGNEPDRGPNPEDTTCANRVQGDTAPEVYARAYFDAYTFIKRIDRTAKVANAGLVQVTPGRLQYWDIVWNTYRSLYGVDMPVDAWNMHLYILPEARPDGQPNGIANIAVGTDPALAIRESGDSAAKCDDPNVYCWAEHDNMTEFAKQAVAMRQWMRDHGQQNKPLILSEYSLLYPYIIDNPADPDSCFLKDEYGECFTSDRVMNFMNNSLSYLEAATDSAIGYPRDGNRLVQRWLWFSVKTDGVGAISNLTNSTVTQLNVVGQTYANRAGAAVRTVNLYPAVVYGAVGLGVNGDGTHDALLTAEVRNLGTIPTSAGFTVSFYREEGLTDLIGSVTVPAGLGGCESRGALAQKAWSNLTPGAHTFWVKVDVDEVIGETQESDNVTQGRVFVSNHGLALPLIFRNSR